MRGQSATPQPPTTPGHLHVHGAETAAGPPGIRRDPTIPRSRYQWPGPSPQVGDLAFVLTVAAARPVRLEPVPPSALYQPGRGLAAADDPDGPGGGTDSDDEEPGPGAVSADLRFSELAYGAAAVKRGRAVTCPPDRRSAGQLAAECRRLRRRYEDPSFPPGPSMLFRDPAGGPAMSAMQEVRCTAVRRRRT
jgi:hypothetical protein